MRIRQSLPQTGTQIPWKAQQLVFRDCGVNPGRGLLLTAEMDREDVREEIVVGNACGGKPGSHGSKAVLLSHA